MLTPGYTWFDECSVKESGLSLTIVNLIYVSLKSNIVFLFAETSFIKNINFGLRKQALSLTSPEARHAASGLRFIYILYQQYASLGTKFLHAQMCVLK